MSAEPMTIDDYRRELRGAKARIEALESDRTILGQAIDRLEGELRVERAAFEAEVAENGRLTSPVPDTAKEGDRG